MQPRMDLLIHLIILKGMGSKCSIRLAGHSDGTDKQLSSDSLCTSGRLHVSSKTSYVNKDLDRPAVCMPVLACTIILEERKLLKWSSLLDKGTRQGGNFPSYCKVLVFQLLPKLFKYRLS